MSSHSALKLGGSVGVAWTCCSPNGARVQREVVDISEPAKSTGCGAA